MALHRAQAAEQRAALLQTQLTAATASSPAGLAPADSSPRYQALEQQALQATQVQHAFLIGHLYRVSLMAQPNKCRVPS